MIRIKWPMIYYVTEGVLFYKYILFLLFMFTSVEMYKDIS